MIGEPEQRLIQVYLKYIVKIQGARHYIQHWMVII